MPELVRVANAVEGACGNRSRGGGASDRMNEEPR